MKEMVDKFECMLNFRCLCEEEVLSDGWKIVLVSVLVKIGWNDVNRMVRSVSVENLIFFIV